MVGLGASWVSFVARRVGALETQPAVATVGFRSASSIFLPPRECSELARECCKGSEVPFSKLLPACECYKLTRECCEGLEALPVFFYLPASVRN